MVFSQADIPYSFEYESIQEFGKAGVKALKEAIKNLFMQEGYIMDIYEYLRKKFKLITREDYRNYDLSDNTKKYYAI